MILEDYLNLITSAWRQKPNFVKTVSLDVSVQVRVQDLMKSMIPKFDIDSAVGVQLDVIGRWVGISRNISVPIVGVYFSWDGALAVGWDYGVWRDDRQPVNISSLPDDAYRTLIRAKIASNSWQGTTESAYDIWERVFQQYIILIQDNQDMSYDLVIAGGTVDSLTLALLTEGYIPLKPEGVRVNTYYTMPSEGKVFGWDVESDYLAGWDEGIWPFETTS